MHTVFEFKFERCQSFRFTKNKIISGNLPNMNKTEFLSLLDKIVKTKTISSDNPKEDFSNMELIDLLKKETASRGGEFIEDTVLNRPPKNNLLIKFGQGDGGLLFSGHTDTVPYDASKWKYDPFTLTELKDRFIGLGIIDMKGFFAHIFAALDKIDLKNLKKPVYILATVDEETTMVGANMFANKEQNIKPDFCLIGEPTSLYPVIQHKGYMAFRITVTGKTGHSSNPDLGVNAIYVMNRIIEQILVFEKELKTKYQDPSFDIPYPSLNIGSIKGGDSPNRICGECEILLDIRPLITTPCSMIEQRLREIINRIPQNDNLQINLSPLYEHIDPFKTDMNNEYVRYLEDLTEHKAISVNYCTEASFLRKLNCPLAICGIGSIDNAHQPNEFMPKEDLEKFHKILIQLIRRICL